MSKSMCIQKSILLLASIYLLTACGEFHVLENPNHESQFIESQDDQSNHSQTSTGESNEDTEQESNENSNTEESSEFSTENEVEFEAFWALAEVRVAEKVKYKKLQSTKATPIFSMRIFAEKGDYLVISAENQLTEDSLKTTRLIGYVTIDGKRGGPIFSQYVSRGNGRNHHMPVFTMGRFRAPSSKYYTISFVVQSSVKTSVTVDSNRMGNLTLKRFHYFTSLTEVKNQRPYFAKTLINGSLKNGVKLIAKKGYQKHPLSRLIFRSQESDDISFITSQGLRKWNNKGKRAEMVVDSLWYYQRQRLHKLHRAGENVGHTLPYASIGLNTVLNIKEGTSYLDMKTYGGNNSGFYQYYNYSYLQGVQFSRSIESGGELNTIDYAKGSKNFNLRTNKVYFLNKNQTMRLEKGSLITASASSLVRNISSKRYSGTCYLKIDLQRAVSGQWKTYSRSKYNVRSLSKYERNASLRAHYSFKVNHDGSYRTLSTLHCRGAKGFKVKTYASGNYLASESFNPILQ